MPPAAQGCFPFFEMWRGLRRHVLSGRGPKVRSAEGFGAREGSGAAARRVSPLGIGVAASLVGHALIVLLAFAWCSSNSGSVGDVPVLEVDLGDIAGLSPRSSGAVEGRVSSGGGGASPAKTQGTRTPVAPDVLVRDKAAREEAPQKPIESAATTGSERNGLGDGNALESATGGAGAGGGGQGAVSGRGTGGMSGGAGSGAVDQLPRILEKVKPLYPEHARRQHKTGVVTLKFLVDAEGRVHQPSVIEASPPGLFEESALAAVAKWRFAPALRQGRPVPTWLILPVRFTLEQ